MARPAQLITPKGKKIDLPPEVYRQVRQLLAARSRRRSRAKLDQAIRATYGKYAGGASLTQALLAERAAERARDVAKLARLHG
ncbi:MAG TPA: hypothetical protein VJ793_15420 [Anaerolineae bacterium]|nr:hypothetical protein [Anaerolineae bacterium]